MFTVGGTDINVHKYLGAKNPSSAESTSDQPRYDAVKETNIQDLLFLENRDRKYSDDIYELRGTYNVSDSDFDLTQFGMFLSNDTLFMTFHIAHAIGIACAVPIRILIGHLEIDPDFINKLSQTNSML